MKPEIIAIFVSFFSVVIAASALGWNIYRDVILKPRLKVRFYISDIIDLDSQEAETHLIINATNHGPGPITCSAIHIRNAPLWGKILGKVERSTIIYDYKHPVCGKLPAKLQYADTLYLLVPFTENCFLAEPVTHVGLRDSFGRIHWAPKKDVRLARKIYTNRFIRKIPIVRI